MAAKYSCLHHHRGMFPNVNVSSCERMIMQQTVEGCRLYQGEVVVGSDTGRVARGPCTRTTTQGVGSVE